MIKDYFHISLAILGGFIMSFCLYIDVYKDNPLIWARLSITGLIFLAFYFHCFKEHSKLFKTSKEIAFEEAFKNIKV